MSTDIRDLSNDNVDQLTRLLSRRPEYGVAIPSRRWLNRQEQKLRSFPSEMLFTSNPLKRLVIKIADSIDPNVIDPRAVLCKTHTGLNPWLIRRLFLAVAYEVTVHTDALRSWKGRKDNPPLSAFIGRIDAIAALWSDPDLYRECYGTPPFENHMVFVKSGCEACILGAVGANARVLADLRAILIDRVERRSSRSDGRTASDPRLNRFIESWINHLKEERAAKCRAMSEDVLSVLRTARPQLMQWRSRRRKEQSSSRATRQPVYTELRKTKSGHRLSNVPTDARRRRRTKHGIPVAMVDLEGAEEQRRVAMYSLQDDGQRSIFRPDSMCDTSQLGQRGVPMFDATNEQKYAASDGCDPYDDYEEMEDEPELEYTLEDVENSRGKVVDWYATRVSRADLSADDTKSVLSMVHPAFRPSNSFSHPSAAPSPLKVRKDRQSASKRHHNESTMWTDATVYTVEPNISTLDLRDAPPVPRIPSEHRPNDGARTPTIRSPRPRSAAPPPQSSRRSVAASSVYSSDQAAPRAPAQTFERNLHSAPPAAMGKPTKKYLFKDSEAGSRVTVHQRQYLRNHKGIRDYSRDDNPFTRGTSSRRTPRPTPTSTPAPPDDSRRATPAPVPSMSSSHGNTIDDDDEPLMTPARDGEAWRRRSWSFHAGDEVADGDEYEDLVFPDDSQSNAAFRELDDEVTPWGRFPRRPK
ncbi:hypothetical protein F4819DRAFT_2985 [Hypoxylon fuscum]|nr:hypothetical protein F4819DRAFT_2985 [Hypoxylon fuscum]